MLPSNLEQIAVTFKALDQREARRRSKPSPIQALARLAAFLHRGDDLGTELLRRRAVEVVTKQDVRCAAYSQQVSDARRRRPADSCHVDLRLEASNQPRVCLLGIGAVLALIDKTKRRVGDQGCMHADQRLAGAEGRQPGGREVERVGAGIEAASIVVMIRRGGQRPRASRGAAREAIDVDIGPAEQQRDGYAIEPTHTGSSELVEDGTRVKTRLSPRDAPPPTHALIACDDGRRITVEDEHGDLRAARQVRLAAPRQVAPFKDDSHGLCVEEAEGRTRAYNRLEPRRGRLIESNYELVRVNCRALPVHEQRAARADDRTRAVAPRGCAHCPSECDGKPAH